LSAVKAHTAEDIKVLCNRQLGDGGFALWKKGERERWPFVSIQVIRALYQAQSKDSKVPQTVLEKGKDYLRKIDQHLPSDYDIDSKRSLRAYALFVRYLIKDADPAAARKLIHECIASYGKKEGRRYQAIYLSAHGLHIVDKNRHAAQPD